MPIELLEYQQAIRQVGRLRDGDQREGVREDGSRYTKPAKLGTWRVTSTDTRALGAVASIYGGEVIDWPDSPNGERQVYTTSTALDVIIVPATFGFRQDLELWDGVLCDRRCDGIRESIRDVECLCAPAVAEGRPRLCKPVTRLSVMLKGVEGLGLWRLDTRSFYAAKELRGSVELVERTGGAGHLLPARLFLDPRSRKVRKRDKGGNVVMRDGRPVVETRRFIVPVLTLDVTPEAFALGAGAVQRAALAPVAEAERERRRLALEAGPVDDEGPAELEAGPPPFTPVPAGAAGNGAPVVGSIAEQVARAGAAPARGRGSERSTTPTLPATGVDVGAPAPVTPPPAPEPAAAAPPVDDDDDEDAVDAEAEDEVEDPAAALEHLRQVAPTADIEDAVTVEDEDVGDAPAAPRERSSAERIAARARKLGLDHHLVVNADTKGRLSSAKDLSEQGVARVFTVLAKIADGELKLVESYPRQRFDGEVDEGPILCALDSDGNPILPPHPDQGALELDGGAPGPETIPTAAEEAPAPPPAPDPVDDPGWSIQRFHEEARAAGVAGPELMDEARRIAWDELAGDNPTSLRHALTMPGLPGRLRVFIEARRGQG